MQLQLASLSSRLAACSANRLKAVLRGGDRPTLRAKCFEFLNGQSGVPGAVTQQLDRAILQVKVARLLLYDCVIQHPFALYEFGPGTRRLPSRGPRFSARVRLDILKT